MKSYLILALLCCWCGRASAAKPVWSWVSANEYYMILPLAQDLKLAVGGTETVKPWGLGLRAVGNETVSKTGGIQLQSVKADGDSFYLLELLLGLEYMTPRTQRPMRFRMGALGDLGLSDTTFFVAPVLTAGFLYTTDMAAETPKGITFDLFYRLTDIDLDNAGHSGAVTLKPAVGFKLGYVFEGFWTVKENK